MAGLGGRGACKGSSLDKELVALTSGAEAGARPGLGDFWALSLEKLLSFIAQQYPLALWGCLCALEIVQERSRKWAWTAACPSNPSG